MSTGPASADFDAALGVAASAARRWLDGVAERPISPRAGIEEVKDALGRELEDEGEDAARVVAQLATAVEPGLMGMPSQRFFGWVIGGAQPASLGADWLVTA